MNDIRTAPRAWAEIDLNAMVNNYRTLRKAAGGAKMMCVIKGDAHGHGAVPLGLALAKEGADAFGVAALSEGVALRKAGIEQPVLVLGWTPAQLADQLAAYRLTQSILDEEYANELNAAGEGLDAPLDVHIKLDTGMTRTGIFAQKDHKKSGRGGLPHRSASQFADHRHLYALRCGGRAGAGGIYGMAARQLLRRAGRNEEAGIR